MCPILWRHTSFDGGRRQTHKVKGLLLGGGHARCRLPTDEPHAVAVVQRGVRRAVALHSDGHRFIQRAIQRRSQHWGTEGIAVGNTAVRSHNRGGNVWLQTLKSQRFGVEAKRLRRHDRVARAGEELQRFDERSADRTIASSQRETRKRRKTLRKHGRRQQVP